MRVVDLSERGSSFEMVPSLLLGCSLFAENKKCLIVLLAAAVVSQPSLALAVIDPFLNASATDPPQAVDEEQSATDTMTCLSSTEVDNKNCIQVVQAQFNRPYQKTFNNSLEFRLIYSYTDPDQTFAVSVESSDADVDHPVLFVVRQQKAVTSWELPYILEPSGHQARYNTFRRTLCPQSASLEPISRIVVDITTSSRSNVTFKLTVSLEADFSVQLKEVRHLTLSPSENYFYKFVFPLSINQVAVQSTSADDVCAIVSIQSPKCPVFDSIYNVEFEGFRQTMTGESSMIIRRDQYPDGFYLVYIVDTDDQQCTDPNQMAPNRANRTKQVTFTVHETISVQDFRMAIFVGTLGVYAAFVVLVIATCILVECRRKRWIRAHETWETTVQTYADVQLPDSLQSHYGDVVRTCETIIRNDSNGSSTDYDPTSNEMDDVFAENSISIPESSISQRDKQSHSEKRWRRVSEMTRQQPDFYNKKSKRFVSELCIIAVFYLVPVGQLVWNHQEMMMATGDQDMCYYNFKCAYPYHLVVDFADFNHFFSNIGYVILGTIFLFITKRRDYIHGMVMLKKNAKEHGIPPHYGLLYSMGFGLIVEGILSACYHVCPTRNNYQFDTSFMYVIAALCTLKLYHARHADVNVKSYMAYIFLAMIVLLGAGTPVHGQVYFQLAFTIIHLTVCVVLSVDIYYMGHWKLNKDRMVEHVNTCWRSRPMYLDRLILVVVGTACNVAFAVTRLWVTDSDVDFNTHILGLFMINLFVYSVFYVVMKMKKREWAFVTRRIYPFLHLLASLAFWFAGSYFFLRKAAKWERSPAGSRMLNQECIAIVYDTHDLWHLLSSAGLFFFFMFLLTLDDDIETIPRRDIPVF